MTPEEYIHERAKLVKNLESCREASRTSDEQATTSSILLYGNSAVPSGGTARRNVMLENAPDYLVKLFRIAVKDAEEAAQEALDQLDSDFRQGE